MPYRSEGRPVETLRRCGSPSSATHAQLDPGRRRPVEPPRGEKPCLESLAKTRRKNCELIASRHRCRKGRVDPMQFRCYDVESRVDIPLTPCGEVAGRVGLQDGRVSGLVNRHFSSGEGIIVRRMTSSFTSQEITKPPMWARRQPHPGEV